MNTSGKSAGALVPCMNARFAHVNLFGGGPASAGYVAQYAGIASLQPAAPGLYACCVNGQYLPRCDWWQPVRDGDVVVFERVPMGGEGSDPARTLLTLALLVVAPQFALQGLLATGAALGSYSTYLALTVAVGSLAINAILPPPGAPGLDGAAPASASPTYSVALQGNSPRFGQPVPVRYGQEFFYPDFAAQPYASFADDQQYFHAALCIGLGRFQILGVFLEDTPIQNFQDVEVLRVGPGQSSFTTPFTGVEAWTDSAVAALVDTRTLTTAEVAGQDLVADQWIGPFTVNPAGSVIDQVSWDIVFPRGLGEVATDGSVDSLSLSHQIGLRLINDAGQAVGPWVNQPITSTSGDTTNVVRRSFSASVTAGRYQVRMRRISAKSDNQRTLNDMQWAQLRSRLSAVRGQVVATGVVRSDVTGLVVRVRASEQLSGSTQRRIGVLARRLLPVYDADTQTWSAPQFTRSPAWALADVWMNTTYGRGLPESRVDLDALVELDEGCTARQDRFDYSFDKPLTTDAAAQLVARVADAATIFRRGALYSVVRDEEQDTEVAAFMPRNIDADTFNLSFTMADEQTADAVELTYRDGQTWSDRVVVGQVYANQVVVYALGDRPGGVPAPQNTQTLTLPGVVGFNHACRVVAKLAADALYLVETAEWTADLDAFLPAFGSLVATAHDAGLWATSGDVVDWDAGTRTLTLSEPASFTDGVVMYVRLVDSVGMPGAAIQVTAGASLNEVVLASDPDEAPVWDSADRERTRYLLGALADVKRRGVVRAIEPQSEDEVRMLVVMEDARRHVPARAFLPAPGEIQDPLSDGAITGDPGDGGGGEGGGSGILVQLTLREYLRDQIGGPGLPVYFELNNDGTGPLGGSIGEGAPVTDEWLTVQPVTATVAGEFEVLVSTDDSTWGGIDPTAVVPVGTGSDVLDVWLSLSVSRTWGIDGEGVRIFYVFIRDVATGTLQATTQFRMRSVVTVPG